MDWTGEERRMNDERRCGVEDRRRDAICPVANDGKCREADRAAEKAVKETFAILGVNIHEPSEVRRFQDDLRFNHEVKGMAKKSKIAVLCTALALLVTLGIKKILDMEF